MNIFSTSKPCAMSVCVRQPMSATEQVKDFVGSDGFMGLVVILLLGGAIVALSRAMTSQNRATNGASK